MSASKKVEDQVRNTIAATVWERLGRERRDARERAGLPMGFGGCRLCWGPLEAPATYVAGLYPICTECRDLFIERLRAVGVEPIFD